jgi:hypothetical protein
MRMAKMPHATVPTLPRCERERERARLQVKAHTAVYKTEPPASSGTYIHTCMTQHPIPDPRVPRCGLHFCNIRTSTSATAIRRFCVLRFLVTLGAGGRERPNTNTNIALPDRQLPVDGAAAPPTGPSNDYKGMDIS